MLPIKLSLRNTARSVEIWRDDLVFRTLDQSVDRLRVAIEQHAQEGKSLAIVTHSFGDWVVRQALAGISHHQVDALVSVAPVLAASPLARVLNVVGGRGISEVPVMADALRAAENSVLDPKIRRLVIWAAVDAWVQRATIADATNLDVSRFWATHLSVIMQPNVHRLVREFLGDKQFSQTELPRKMEAVS